jgi:hypothetical protein
MNAIVNTMFAIHSADLEDTRIYTSKEKMFECLRKEYTKESVDVAEERFGADGDWWQTFILVCPYSESREKWTFARCDVDWAPKGE